MTIEVTLEKMANLLEVIAKNTATNMQKPADPVPTPSVASAVVTPKPKKEKPAAPAPTPAPAPVATPSPVVEEDDDFLGEEPPAAKTLTKDDVRAAFVKLQNGRPDGKNQVYAVLKQFGATSLGTLAVDKYGEAVAAVDALLK